MYSFESAGPSPLSYRNRTNLAIFGWTIYVEWMPLLVPSIYWPIARCGFSRNPRLRRVFRLLVSNLWRKRFWNPVINSWAKNRGFDQRSHILANNTHAICSALVLPLILVFLWAAQRATADARLLPPESDFARSMTSFVHTCYRWAIGLSIFELVYNTGGIILSRYLYLLTVRRPAIHRARSTPRANT